jgi:SSS family solute:Na+ symporter
MMFDSIYDAHGAFTAAVTPPLVVTLLLSVFWRRFTRQAALWTLAGGLFAMGLSLFVPEVIWPFAHGVPMKEVEETFLSGMKQYKFMRACYGVVVCGVIGVVVTLLTRPGSAREQRGLVWGTIADALHRYKGAPGTERDSRPVLAAVSRAASEEETSDAGWPLVRITRALADALGAEPGDLLYVTDRRRWLGGLRSAHVMIATIDEADRTVARIELGPGAHDAVVVPRRAGERLRVERLY